MPETDSSFLALLRGLPPRLYVVAFATLVSRSGGFLAIFGSIYLTSLSVSNEQVVVVLTAIGVVGMSASLLSGRIADRVGPKPVLVTVSLGNAAILALLATGPDAGISIALVIVASALTQSFVPPAAAVVGALAPDARSRTPFFAFFRLFLNIGSTTSPLIAAALGEMDFSRLFVYSAIANAVAAVLLAAGIRRVAPAAGGGANATDHDARRGRGPRVATFVFFAVLGVVAGIYAQFQSTLPLQIRDVHNDLTLYSGLIVVNSLIIIVGELPLSAVTRSLPIGVPLAGGVLLMTIGISLSGLFARETGLLLFSAVLFTVGEMIFAPVANTAAATIAPAGRAATYQSYLSAAQALGFALGPAVGVAAYFGLGVGVWWSILGVGTACVVLLAVVLRSVLAANRATLADVPVTDPVDHSAPS